MGAGCGGAGRSCGLPPVVLGIALGRRSGARRGSAHGPDPPRRALATGGGAVPGQLVVRQTWVAPPRFWARRLPRRGGWRVLPLNGMWPGFPAATVCSDGSWMLCLGLQIVWPQVGLAWIMGRRCRGGVADNDFLGRTLMTSW